MPKLGIGPKPSPSTALNTTCTKHVISKALEGVRMLPEPRMTEARALVSQMLIEPANATWAYNKHCARASPLPPNALKMDALKSANTKVNNKPMPSPMRVACKTKALALAKLLAPMARLMAEVMPPPMEPADNICCSITNGNTKAMPAKGMMPN